MWKTNAKLSWFIMGSVALLLLGTAAFGGVFETKGTFERTLRVTGPVNLEITTNSGDISVVSGDDGEVHIKGTIHVNQDWIFGNRDGEARIRAIQRNPPIEQHGG
ncbi:MAG TPA: hypothetical protein VMX16_18485 [Terriglobia bacterium]|nr:hypothetical protein [Terriglobia bacterium]